MAPISQLLPAIPGKVKRRRQPSFRHSCASSGKDAAEGTTCIPPANFSRSRNEYVRWRAVRQSSGGFNHGGADTRSNRCQVHMGRRSRRLFMSERLPAEILSDRRSGPAFWPGIPGGAGHPSWSPYARLPRPAGTWGNPRRISPCSSRSDPDPGTPEAPPGTGDERQAPGEMPPHGAAAPRCLPPTSRPARGQVADILPGFSVSCAAARCRRAGRDGRRSNGRGPSAPPRPPRRSPIAAPSGRRPLPAPPPPAA